MKTIGLVFLLACMAASANPRRVEFHCGSINASNYVQVLSVDELEGYPVWEPKVSQCPLSPHQAVILGYEAMQEALPETAGWSPKYIRMIHALGNTIWVYAVHFIPSDHYTLGPFHKSRSSIMMIVRLDGLVPELTPLGEHIGQKRKPPEQ